MSEILSKANLLIVDDTLANLQLLSSLFVDKDYKVRSVISGPMALTAMKTVPPDLVLLDINMPEMNGYQVCEIIKSDPALCEIPVIFISALDDLQDIVKAFAVGGVDYITKPFQMEEVIARVNTHLTLRRTQVELELAKGKLEFINCDQERIIQEQVKKISSSQLATIFALAKLADSRDQVTGSHLERTRELCKSFTEKLGDLPRYHEIINSEFVENVSTASILHDIGKVGIPDHILQKPGKLDQEEFNKIKEHTTIGAEALREVDRNFPDNTMISMGIRIAESHHEKWDGSGYPFGLAGENIPLESRIFALVDVYDALTSERPYKSAYSHAESLKIMISERGRHFEPEMVDVFIRN